MEMAGSWLELFSTAVGFVFVAWLVGSRPESLPLAAAPAPAPEETQDVARPPPADSRKKTPTTRFAEIHALNVVSSEEAARLRREEWAKRVASQRETEERTAAALEKYEGGLGIASEMKSTAVLEHKAKQSEPAPLPSRPVSTPPPTPPQTPPKSAGDDVGKTAEVPQDPLPALQPTPPPTPDAGDDVAADGTRQQVPNHFEGLGTPKRTTPSCKPTNHQCRDFGAHRPSPSRKISPELDVPSLSAIQKGKIVCFTWRRNGTYTGITKSCARLRNLHLQASETDGVENQVVEFSNGDMDERMHVDEMPLFTDAQLSEDHEMIDVDEQDTQPDTLRDENMDVDEGMMLPTTLQDPAPQTPAAPMNTAPPTPFAPSSTTMSSTPPSYSNSQAGFVAPTSSLPPNSMANGPPAMPQGFMAPKTGAVPFAMMSSNHTSSASSMTPATPLPSLSTPASSLPPSTLTNGPSAFSQGVSAPKNTGATPFLMTPSHTTSTSSSTSATSLPGLGISNQSVNSNNGSNTSTAFPSNAAAPNSGLASSTFSSAQQPASNSSSAANPQVGSSTSSPFAPQAPTSFAQTVASTAPTGPSTSASAASQQLHKPSTRIVQPPAQQDPGAPTRNSVTPFSSGSSFTATSSAQTQGDSPQQNINTQPNLPTGVNDDTFSNSSLVGQSGSADSTFDQSSKEGPDKGKRKITSRPAANTDELALFDEDKLQLHNAQFASGNVGHLGSSVSNPQAATQQSNPMPPSSTPSGNAIPATQAISQQPPQTGVNGVQNGTSSNTPPSAALSTSPAIQSPSGPSGQQASNAPSPATNNGTSLQPFTPQGMGSTPGPSQVKADTSMMGTSSNQNKLPKPGFKPILPKTGNPFVQKKPNPPMQRQPNPFAPKKPSPLNHAQTAAGTASSGSYGGAAYGSAASPANASTPYQPGQRGGGTFDKIQYPPSGTNSYQSGGYGGGTYGPSAPPANGAGSSQASSPPVPGQSSTAPSGAPKKQIKSTLELIDELKAGLGGSLTKKRAEAALKAWRTKTRGEVAALRRMVIPDERTVAELGALADVEKERKNRWGKVLAENKSLRWVQEAGEGAETIHTFLEAMCNDHNREGAAEIVAEAGLTTEFRTFVLEAFQNGRELNVEFDRLLGYPVKRAADALEKLFQLWGMLE